MILFCCFLIIFVCAYYKYERKMHESPANVNKSNEKRLDFAKSEMSEDEFSEPSSAGKRFRRPDELIRGKKKNANKTLGNRGLFDWQSKFKKPRVGSETLEDVELVDLSKLSDDESDVDVTKDCSDIENMGCCSNGAKVQFGNTDGPVIPNVDHETNGVKREAIMDSSSIIPMQEPYVGRKSKFNNPQSTGVSLMISGVAIKFPKSPYNSQMSVMNYVIKACKNSQNCLIESPTGSGKTLALLCSALAWQQEEKKKMFAAATQVQPLDPGKAGAYGDKGIAESEDDFFDLDKFEQKPMEKRTVIPKIFYGARTHKQIEQVVREFGNTFYRDVPMTILSSREHTCIMSNKESKMSKTQLCNNLLDPKFKRGCEFFKDSKTSCGTWASLQTPWDIEDLVEYGIEHKACPYFAARNMMEAADIVFCPYNYLIDPVIRDSMAINLKGHVVIIDEAHNIENICRDVGSTSFREDHLSEAADDCRCVFAIDQNHAYEDLQYYLDALLVAIRNQTLPKANPSNMYAEITSSFLKGEDAWTQFTEIHRLGNSRFQQFRSACQVAFRDYNDMKENAAASDGATDDDVLGAEEAEETNAKTKAKAMKKKKGVSTISFVTKRLLEELLMSLDAIQNVKYRNDFRVMTSLSYHRDAKTKVQENKWISKDNDPTQLRTLKFLCMNSAMIFSQVSYACRSMVLASGTLTPTSTFESELGTKFKHKLNANHVITNDQVYARVVRQGPTGIPLRFTYAEVQSLTVRDELGRVLVDVCESVPHGVLCFFSSYTVMNDMLERWRGSDAWLRITARKQVILEPRKTSELDAVMNSYREVIRDTSDGPNYYGQNGAILFAVFRGKMAEGIDFSDNEARCVISVGIPYPNARDPQIQMKKEYNDAHVKSNGLMTGSQWYNIQAYRALNQALGRCIRHKSDWGAILLVDERLLGENSVSHLPKWIRTMNLRDNIIDLRKELGEFVANRKKIDKQKKN